MKGRAWSLAGLIVAVLVLSAALGAQPAGKAPNQQLSEQPASLSPQELFKRISPSVFVVEALDAEGSVVAFGSGVAVAPDQVVTNKHVIDDGIAWRVRQGDNTWPARVTHLDADHDLCLLTVNGLKAPPVEVRPSSTLEVGERVYAIGAPEGLEFSLSEGLISGLREYDAEARIIQTTAAVSHGSSGGGLFDAQARLIGVITLFVKEGQNLNFALPGEWVLGLNDHRIATEPRSESDSPAFRALVWVQLGNKAYSLGHYQKAIEAYEQALRLKPEYFWIWYNLGLAYSSLGNYDKAISALRKAIRLAPNFADAWYSLGNVYGGFRQYHQAISAYKEATRLNPGDGDAWRQLGTAYSLVNQYNRATSALQEAIRLNPDDADAWGSLGNTYGMMQQYDQAVAALEEALRLNPKDGATWYTLGIAYSGLGQRSKVLEVYQQLKILDPNRADKFFREYVLP